MPALSPTMEKGTLARWLVSVGDAVKAGDMLAEVETDKATMEVECHEDGQVCELLVPAGTDGIAVGTIIARLAPGVGERSDHGTQPVVPVADTTPAAPDAQASVPLPALAPAIVPMPVSAVRGDTAIAAAPLARRLAKAMDIALEGVAGSGPDGRVVRADLRLPSFGTFAPGGSASIASVSDRPEPSLFAAHGPAAGVPVSSARLSSMRRTIARRLSESKQSIPHFYLTARCNIDSLLRLRTALNDDLASRGIKVSVNDMLIKAVAIALCEVPEANVQFGGDVLYQYERVDISVAVAVPNGLVTPVLRDAGELGLAALSQQARILAGKAREGALLPEEYQGGTASISNLGMYGIDEISPIINLPQALIVGVGAGIEQPWRVDGGIALATIMAVTASFDHRAIDGAIAARFMSALRDLIENPLWIVC